MPMHGLPKATIALCLYWMGQSAPTAQSAPQVPRLCEAVLPFLVVETSTCALPDPGAISRSSLA